MMEKDQIMRTLQQLKPVIGKKAEKLWQMYLLSGDADERAELAQVINLMAEKRLDNFNIQQINLIPPENKIPGKYSIGMILYGRDFLPVGNFSLTDQDWIRHIGIFGSTGAGKTTVVYNLIGQLAREKKPFLILDWKRDYRDLLKNPEFKDILVFTVGRKTSPFQFNPKEKPPGVDENVWLKKLQEIISHAYLLGPGAEDVMMENRHYPTFGEMQEHLNKQRKKARELLWWSSAKRTLNAINFPGLSEVVNSKSFDIPALLDKQVILELDSLSDSDKVFLIGSLLMWIYYYRMAQPDRERWKHTIFLEEAHHLLLRQPDSKPENYADTLMREVRVFGQAMVVIDQRPSKISDSALANINTKVCLGLNLAQDILAMSKALLLERQQQNFIGMLKVGRAIVKSQRITFPFLCQLPDFNIKKGIVSDEEVRNIMQKHPEVSSTKKAQLPESKGFQGIPKDESPPSPLAKILLQDIAENPFEPVSRRYKKLGLSNSAGNATKDELVSKDLAVPSTIDGKTLLDLTQKSRGIIKDWGINAFKAKGSIEHSYWLEQVRQYLNARQGFTFIEKDDIDLVAVSLDENDEKVTAVQVETGKSNIKKNIKTLTDYKADDKLIIATNKETEIKLRQMVPDKSGIDVMFVKDFLK
jgi:hypothetical protein